MTVTLEYEMAPVAYPPGPRCAFDGRPGEWRPCCDRHAAPMCDVCRETKGAVLHAHPADLRKD